ncbi:extracellular solute-binding protein family 1 (plasmid) [Haloterrigena turkmenica DSM 5511]|uniref:Extracellular solute-binding protein family 1 n=2 Tax=Haloterrigena turkmenica TaxID=62320 RepID=D2S238_HALTV|nr:extracellular solute-binding protein family 1 [Haloterrigena turkmenica DSM 5511]
MGKISKRDFLKASGIAAASIAGCLGGNDQLTFWWIDGDSTEYQDLNDWIEETVEADTERQLEITGYAYSDLHQNVLTGGRQGTPDVIEGVIEHPGDYVAADIIEPLTDRTDEIPHFNGFLESALDAFRFQDELWALPYTGNGRAIVYNKEVLAEYGYEDGPPSEIDEFMELAGTINADYDDMNGFHLTTERGEVRATQEFLSHVYQHTDGSLYEWDGDGWALQADSDVFEAILGDIYYRLFHGDQPTASSAYQSAGYETNDIGFTEGEHAMIHCGPWINGFRDTDAQAEMLDEKVAVSLLPKHADASDATYMEVKPAMINTHSNDLESALSVASTFTSPETIERMGEINSGTVATPVHEDVESTLENEDYMAFIDAFENGVAPAPIAWGPVREGIYDAIEYVIFDEQTPAEAANELEQTLEEANVELNPNEE